MASKCTSKCSECNQLGYTAAKKSGDQLGYTAAKKSGDQLGSTAAQKSGDQLGCTVAEGKAGSSITAGGSVRPKQVDNQQSIISETTTGTSTASESDLEGEYFKCQLPVTMDTSLILPYSRIIKDYTATTADVKVLKTIKFSATSGGYDPLSKMVVIKEELWCTLSQSIRVYDWDGHLKRSIPLAGLVDYARAAYPVNDSVILLLDEFKLKVVTWQGRCLEEVCTGYYSDACWEGGKLYLLNYQKAHIDIVKHSRGSWNRPRRIKLDTFHYNIRGLYDRISVSPKNIIIASHTNMLYTFNLQGSFIKKMEMTFSDGETVTSSNRVLMCGVDYYDRVMLTNMRPGLFLILSKSDKWKVVKTLPARIKDPTQIACCRGKTSMWVASGFGVACNKIYKIGTR